MGSKASTNLQEEEIQEIQKETGFTPNQIIRLYSRFTSLDKSGNGHIVFVNFLTVRNKSERRKEDFMRIPELAINPLASRIINLFFLQTATDDIVDPDGGEAVNFHQFARTLARFRPVKPKGNNDLNSRIEKLRFAFKMYDLDNDDQINRNELLNVLHMMVGANISEEQLGSIADRTISEADSDQDGVISFDEFVKIMEKVDVEQKMSIRFLS